MKLNYSDLSYSFTAASSTAVFSHNKTSASGLRPNVKTLSSSIMGAQFSINRSTRRCHIRKRCRSGVTCLSTSPFVFPSALLFDCDGVLVNPEKDGHRISFNDTFAARELGVTWDVDLYGELLKIGGGKERMTAYFNKTGWPEKAPKSEQKTELFMALIEKKLLRLRPGVANRLSLCLQEPLTRSECGMVNVGVDLELGFDERGRKGLVEGMSKPKLFWILAAAPLASVILSTLLVTLLRSKAHGIATEGIAVGRTFAALKKYQVDGNKEMMTISLMNMAGSCSSCYVTTGDYPLFFVNLLKIIVTKHTINFLHFNQIFRVIFSCPLGLAIAVGVSVFKVLLHVTRPNTVILGNIPRSQIYQSLGRYRDSLRIPSFLILAVETPIYFANQLTYKK
ncbi:unnamed protein product, partial [Ilex paraguariensis]